MIHHSPRFDIEPTFEGKVEFFTPPASFAVRDHRWTDDILARQVRALSPGEQLLSSDYFRHTSLAPDGMEGSFREDPELGYGREQSGNVVSFGQLLLASPKFYDLPSLVAVKPFHTAADALNEFGAMAALNSMRRRGGEQRDMTFKPVGFCGLEGDMGVGLLTRYDHPVRTLDNIFWNPEDSVRTPERLARAAAHAGFAVGATAYLGVIHNDAQVKNLAESNEGVKVVDLAEAQPIDLTDDPEAIREAVARDLSVCVDSLYAPGDTPDGRYDHLIVSKLLPNFFRLIKLPTSKIPPDAIPRVSTNFY